jgi:hypothetical protein
LYILATNYPKISRKTPFTTAKNKTKYVGITLRKEVKDLDTKKYKTLMKN